MRSKLSTSCSLATSPQHHHQAPPTTMHRRHCHLADFCGWQQAQQQARHSSHTTGRNRRQARPGCSAARGCSNPDLVQAAETPCVNKLNQAWSVQYYCCNSIMAVVGPSWQTYRNIQRVRSIQHNNEMVVVVAVSPSSRYRGHFRNCKILRRRVALHARCHTNTQMHSHLGL